LRRFRVSAEASARGLDLHAYANVTATRAIHSYLR
jgi:hypothetical protein